MQNKKEGGEDLFLACKWTYWYVNTLPHSKKKKIRDYYERTRYEVKPIFTFKTVGEYWSLYDMIYKVQELIPNTDYLVFKSYIAPQWEDPQNRDGGKWVYTIPLDADPDPDLLQDIWLRMLAALIGNNFGEQYNNLVNGAVFGVREKHYRYGLWIGTNSNLKALKNIGKKFRELCELPKKFQLVYQVHVKALKHQLDNEFLLEA